MQDGEECQYKGLKRGVLVQTSKDGKEDTSKDVTFSWTAEAIEKEKEQNYCDQNAREEGINESCSQR